MRADRYLCSLGLVDQDQDQVTDRRATGSRAMDNKDTHHHSKDIIRLRIKVVESRSMAERMKRNGAGG